MGYTNSESIREFVKGKTIDNIEYLSDQGFVLNFEDGESLRLYCQVKMPTTPGVTIIATPFDKNNEVLQTTIS